MIQAMHTQRFEVLERPQVQAAAGSASLAGLFGDGTKAATEGTALAAAPAADSASDPASTASAAGSGLGEPDVQNWLDSYYTEIGAASFASTSYQPAPGAGSNYSADSVYGPDQIYTQALYNQGGNAFAALTGDNPANLTSQLPGIPSQPVQEAFDRDLALENAQRLASGQPIDTGAYWSDPGPLSFEGTTYTSQELGYAGPEQSSGPQPIYISQGDQIPGTNNFSVPGYSGTVTGIQANGYYTLEQLENAGLKAGQPDAQFHPGSWTTTPNA